jgi:hypothetical protein
VRLMNELQELLVAVVAGDRPLADLYHWLAEHVQAVAERRNPWLSDVFDGAWLAIAEWQADVLDERGLRARLAELAATYHVWEHEPSEVTSSADPELTSFVDRELIIEATPA